MCLSAITSNQKLQCSIKANKKGLSLSVLSSHVNFQLKRALYCPPVDSQQNTSKGIKDWAAFL